MGGKCVAKSFIYILDLRLLYISIALIFLSCKSQSFNDVNEIYNIVNTALNEYSSNYQFKLAEESNNYDIYRAFNVYAYNYKKHKETGEIRPAPMVKKGTEWVLNRKDIEYISKQMKQDSTKVKWNRDLIKAPQVVFETGKRIVQVKLSKPFLNKDKTKAVIFLDEVLPPEYGYGYLLLLKKVGDNWVACGKIDYRVS